MTDLPRVVYLSASPHGKEMLPFLQTLPCDVVGWTCVDFKINWKEAYDYDLGLNFLGTHKIPEEEVIRPKLGWVNFHPAPLPEFGGRNVAFHAIESGAKEFGATVHYMDAEFDKGPIIEVKRFDTRPEDTAGGLMDGSILLLKLLFKKWVPELLKGKVPATPQPPGSVRYFPQQKIDDEVLLTGGQEREIRARTCHPNHHAVVVVGGKRYRIYPEVDDA